MPHLSEGRLGMYRCPVCSYRDMVHLEGGEATSIVPCAHCETPLKLRARGAHSLTLEARVAEHGLSST